MPFFIASWQAFSLFNWYIKYIQSDIFFSLLRPAVIESGDGTLGFCSKTQNGLISYYYSFLFPRQCLSLYKPVLLICILMFSSTSYCFSGLLTPFITHGVQSTHASKRTIRNLHASLLFDSQRFYHSLPPNINLNMEYAWLQCCFTFWREGRV
jgi:hypothetical protein